MTVPTRSSKATDLPANAWRQPIGTSGEAVGRPRIGDPIIDDGPWAGVPIGGLGAGSIGRTQRGDFARWHLRVGRHVFRPVPACAFSLFVEDPETGSRAHVLSTLRPDSLGAWSWDLPVGAGTYHALFPRAWYEIDWDELPVSLVQAQMTPVLPGNVRESSYPLGLFEWRVHNRSDRRLRVGLMFTWQNVDEDAEGTPVGATNQARREGEVVGVVLRNGSGADGVDPSPEFAILAVEDDGARASYRARFDTEDGTDVWADFAADGALDDLDDDRPARAGEGIGAAVAVTFDLEPGAERSARFSMAWDIPVMRFGEGTGWYRRYTRFFGREGGAAWRIAAEGLDRQQEWTEAIEAWQAPILEDPDRPEWYAPALFNELYVLVDGGTAWEDGLVGSAPPEEGEGRFCFLECYDYPFYNTHDVLFYASWALVQLWPSLERRTVRSLAASVPVADDRAMTIETGGAVVRRKERGSVPHDLGAPFDDPWLSLNAYRFQDPNRWKDLNSKFVLQLWRDRVLLDDAGLVREGWPSVVEAIEYLARYDRDGDGLPEHEGIPDQTFDTWPMLGPSAYGGGLWLAALTAAIAMADELGDTERAARYAAWRTSGIEAYEKRLWNGRYFRYDGSGAESSESVMADQLCGLWYADATGLEPFVPADQARSALLTIVERNVRGFMGGRMGAVNGTRPDGSVDISSEQSQEVWPGVTYALAALLLHRGMDAEAWETAEGAVATTHDRGLRFRTPEAWDRQGDFRASIYMRPLSIWAIEHALRSRGRPAAG
jgi:non-lysosomal glucosylceramidase